MGKWMFITAMEARAGAAAGAEVAAVIRMTTALKRKKRGGRLEFIKAE